MVSLKSAADRFEIMFSVVEGGSGVFKGVLSETDQNNQPSYIFVRPRHVLRVKLECPVIAGMVVRSPGGSIFILGDNGPSEHASGTLWKSFRLFEPTGRYLWVRRTKVKDPITRQDREGPLQEIGMIWAAIEPMDREMSDREIRASFEQARFIAAADIKSDDLVGNRAVTKVDRQLGLAIGVVT